MYRLSHTPLPSDEELLGAGLSRMHFFLGLLFLRLSTGPALLQLLASVPQSLVAKEDLGCLDFYTQSVSVPVFGYRVSLPSCYWWGVGLNTCCTAHPDSSLGFRPRGFCAPVHSPVPLATFTYFGLQGFQLSPSSAENGVCTFSFPVLFAAFGRSPGGEGAVRTARAKFTPPVASRTVLSVCNFSTVEDCKPEVRRPRMSVANNMTRRLLMNEMLLERQWTRLLMHQCHEPHLTRHVQLDHRDCCCLFSALANARTMLFTSSIRQQMNATNILTPYS